MQIKCVSGRQDFSAVTALRGEKVSEFQHPPLPHEHHQAASSSLSDGMEGEEECEVALICRLKEITQLPIPIDSN